jgi:hypothetical protein
VSAQGWNSTSAIYTAANSATNVDTSASTETWPIVTYWPPVQVDDWPEPEPPLHLRGRANPGVVRPLEQRRPREAPNRPAFISRGSFRGRR